MARSCSAPLCAASLTLPFNIQYDAFSLLLKWTTEHQPRWSSHVIREWADVFTRPSERNQVDVLSFVTRKEFCCQYRYRYAIGLQSAATLKSQTTPLITTAVHQSLNSSSGRTKNTAGIG